jgi:hypothetical protein
MARTKKSTTPPAKPAAKPKATKKPVVSALSKTEQDVAKAATKLKDAKVAIKTANGVLAKAQADAAGRLAAYGAALEKKRAATIEKVRVKLEKRLIAADARKLATRKKKEESKAKAVASKLEAKLKAAEKKEERSIKAAAAKVAKKESAASKRASKSAVAPTTIGRRGRPPTAAVAQPEAAPPKPTLPVTPTVDPAPVAVPSNAAESVPEGGAIE